MFLDWFQAIISGGNVIGYEGTSPHSCYLPDAAALFNLEATSLCTNAFASVALI